MGIRACCNCPDRFDIFVGQWVRIWLANSEESFLGRWFFAELDEDSILVRRRIEGEFDGWQRVVIPCHQIVAIMRVPPPGIEPVPN
ncbi:MAG TPA: hypothetical protein GX528_02310 [Firmicutes bacterium]|nr:hypothetical protein [Bacillota bacterium]